ncbi:MAG: hypothetical protein WAM61_15105 [Desulfobacterales bacterium]
MAEYSQIEKKRLWEMAKNGRSAEELQKEFDIRDMAALKQIMQEMMRETGESVVVPGLVGRAALRAEYTSEGIRISPDMLDGTGFKSGDEFDLKVTGSGISLQKRLP